MKKPVLLAVFLLLIGLSGHSHAELVGSFSDPQIEMTSDSNMLSLELNPDTFVMAIPDFDMDATRSFTFNWYSRFMEDSMWEEGFEGYGEIEWQGSLNDFFNGTYGDNARLTALHILHFVDFDQEDPYEFQQEYFQYLEGVFKDFHGESNATHDFEVSTKNGSDIGNFYRYSGITSNRIEVEPVPLPSAGYLLGSGLLGLVCWRIRRDKRIGTLFSGVVRYPKSRSA